MHLEFKPWRLAAALGVFLFSSSLRADWLDLKDGASLRGLDYQERGGRAAFTLEDGKKVVLARELVAGVRKSPPGEKVEFRGRQVSLREMVSTLQAEDRKREKEARRWIEDWARGKKDAAKAEESFKALPAEDRARFLTSALLQSKRPEARALAARELSAHKARASTSALVWAAATDTGESVRSQSLASLQALKDPETSDRFLPFLHSSSPKQRTWAAEGLEAFPGERAVPVLIETMRLAWTGFGRGFTFQGEERAYISDYELVSGGTGFSIIEVADPVIGKVQTGVVLDVEVQKVEMFARRRALKKMTGQDFGDDVARWRAWLKEKNQAKDQPQAPAASPAGG